MKQGLKRFRRMATACAAGTIGLSVISVLGFSSVASAAVVSPVGSSITALSAPNIAPGAINSPAGNLSFNIAPGTTWTAGSVLSVSVADHLGNPATIKFAGAPLATANTGAGDAALCGAGVLNCVVFGTGTNTLSVVLTGTPAQSTPTVSPESLVISGIGYTTTAAVATGFVTITTGLTNFATGPPASNAVVATPPTTTFVADNTPIIPPGATTAAGPQEIFLQGNNTTWATGDKMYVTVARNDALNCETVGRPDSVGFAGTPNVSVTAAAGSATATPALTATFATAPGSSCATFSGVNNEMVLTFTNSGTIITGAANPIDITISGVKYTVSADVGDVSAPLPNTNNLGNIATGLSYNVLPTYVSSGFPGSVPNDELGAPSHANTGAPGGPSNANININSLIITSNKPSTTINFNATASGGEVVNQPISPITIAEPNPGALSGGVTGWACIALNPGAGPGTGGEFVSTPTVTATGGGLAVGNVSLVTPGGQTGPTELAFQVTTASTGTPGTVTVSGISVNVPSNVGFMPVAELAFAASNVADACNLARGAGASTGTLYVNPVTGANSFPYANTAARIFGQDQDATAAQAFELPGPVGGGPTCNAGLTPSTPAVLVTNGSYQDALSASYLAGQLHTGILTTNTNTVSPEALQALAISGVTEVFVVGGPLVVSPADITQLENTPAYRCGTHGVTPRVNSLGQPVNLVVQQIFGQTADDTAMAVATFPGAGIPGTANFQGAYAGTFNHTSGSSGSPASSAPDVPVTTAILATDQSFTDAASASVVAYHGSAQNGNGHGFPLLLTGPSTLSPGAAEGLANDSVQQVIVMGGPIAISDNVLSQIEAMGIAVIRIAGQDFTDTSQLLGQFDLNSVNSANQANGLDYDPFAVTLARGDYYTDAIVASAVAGRNVTPILLTWDPNNTGQPGGTDYLGQFLTMVGQTLSDPGTPRDGTINNLLFFGGTFAISNALQATIGHDLNG